MAWSFTTQGSIKANWISDLREILTRGCIGRAFNGCFGTVVTQTLGGWEDWGMVIGWIDIVSGSVFLLRLRDSIISVRRGDNGRAIFFGSMGGARMGVISDCLGAVLQPAGRLLFSKCPTIGLGSKYCW